MDIQEIRFKQKEDLSKYKINRIYNYYTLH